jgi:hypothetical protein
MWDKIIWRRQHSALEAHGKNGERIIDKMGPGEGLNYVEIDGTKGASSVATEPD